MRSKADFFYMVVSYRCTASLCSQLGKCRRRFCQLCGTCLHGGNRIQHTDWETGKVPCPYSPPAGRHRGPRPPRRAADRPAAAPSWMAGSRREVIRLVKLFRRSKLSHSPTVPFPLRCFSCFSSPAPACFACQTIAAEASDTSHSTIPFPLRCF